MKKTLVLKFWGTSLFWFEKLNVIVDYAQIFGVIWCMTQPWPWPYIWLKWTRFMVYFNLDIYSTTFNGALMGRGSAATISRWGQYSGYLLYATYFCILPLIITLSCILILSIISKFGIRMDRYRAAVIKFSLIILQFLYVPCGLALFRLFHCSNSYLEADPDVSCTSAKYKIITSICCILCIPYLVLLPVVLHQYVFRVTVYREAPDHEKRLQVWELMYIISLDSFWEESQAWVMSSFTRSAAYFRVSMLAYKMAILIIFISCRVDPSFQSAALWFVTVGFVLFMGVIPPYRTISTNIIFYILMALLIIDVTTALFNANRVLNYLTSPSIESIILIITHFLAATGIVIVILLSQFNILDYWPVLDTIKYVLHNQTTSKVLQWIAALRHARQIQIDCVCTSPEYIDIFALEDTLRLLRRYWLAARRYGSLFEIPLSDMLEELLILHADVSEAASRKNELWDRLCRDTSDVFFKHWYRTLLMSPRKRSILLKLLAVRAFMGRRERFINGKIVFDHVIDMRRLSDMKNGKSSYSLESVPVDLGGTSLEAEFKDDAEWKLLEAQIPQMIVQSDDMLKCKPWDITDTDVFSKLQFLNTFWNRVLDVHGRVTVQRNKPTVQVWEGYSKEFGGALLLLEGENRSVDGGGEKLHGDREGVEDDGRRVDDGAMEGMRKAMLRASIINHLGGSIYSESSESLAGLSESASRRVTIVQSTPLFYLPRPSHGEVPSPVSSRRESGSGGNLTGLEYALKNYEGGGWGVDIIP